MPPTLQLLPCLYVKQIRENGNQYYIDAKGIKLPSVTTILNATKPQEDRDRLASWRQRVGTDEANRISGTASRRGTQTHKQIQRYLLGETVPCSEASQSYWESIEPVLQDIDMVRLIESPVFNYDLSYGGRVDCVASYKGIPCICEWKTADKPKGSIERLYEHPLQLAAYLGAINHCYRDYGVTVNHTLLVVAIPDSPSEIFWFDPKAMKNYWQQWEKRVAQYWKRRGY